MDGFELVAAAPRFSPELVRARYGDFLRHLMQGVGLEGRTTFDDGQVVPRAPGSSGA